jgi:hypothetical protein
MPTRKEPKRKPEKDRKRSRGRPTINGGKSVLVGFRLSKELRQRLKLSAKQKGLTVSQCVEEFVRNALEQERRNAN